VAVQKSEFRNQEKGLTRYPSRESFLKVFLNFFLNFFLDGIDTISVIVHLVTAKMILKNE
jgi:hypothetical protein